MEIERQNEHHFIRKPRRAIPSRCMFFVAALLFSRRFFFRGFIFPLLFKWQQADSGDNEIKQRKNK